MKKIYINNFFKHLILDCGLKKEFINEIMEFARQKQISFISYLIQTKVVDSFYLARLLAGELFLTYIDLDSINPSKIPINIIDQRYQ